MEMVSVFNTRTVKILISHSQPISSRITLTVMLLYWKLADRAVDDLTGSSVRYQPSLSTSFRRGGAQSRPRSYQDSAANSRRISVVVTQEPAQPLATLYSFVTTSFRD